MRPVLDFLLDLIYPPFCLRCGRPGEFLCERCYSCLDFVLSDDLTPTLFHDISAQDIYLCRVQSTLVYTPLVQKMLHHYKYLSVRDLSTLFAYWMYQYTDFGQPDVISFIPIHRRRHQERGYNQARLLAQALSQLSGIPCQPLLARSVYKSHQAASKNKQERLDKTKDIFAAVPVNLSPSTRILLVDDVVTTGATLNEAARVLSKKHHCQISALTLAHGATN